MLVYRAKTQEFITIDAYSKVPANPKLRDMLVNLPGVKESAGGMKEEPREPGRPRLTAARRRRARVEGAGDRGGLDARD